ncbi:MAG: stage III sporulation AC/AD family protein [Oscillospiraceae bacterium]
MELAIKAAAAGIAAVLAASIIKKNNPELSLLLALAACAVILASAMGLGEKLMEVVGEARRLSGLSPAVLTPIVKCVGIGIIAKVGADACRDAGSTSVASSVELTGAMAALFCALPMVTALLSMLRRMA